MTQNQILSKLNFSETELKQKGKEITKSYKDGKTQLNYSDSLTQEAYLYQYIEKYNFGIVEKKFDKVALFGCGPCIESLRFDQTQDFVIVDKYAKSWSKTRRLILPDSKISQVLELDFTESIIHNKELESCECFYFQNCLNEISENQLYRLLKNIEYLSEFGDVMFVDFADYPIVAKVFDMLKQNYTSYICSKFEKDGTKFIQLKLLTKTLIK